MLCVVCVSVNFERAILLNLNCIKMGTKLTGIEIEVPIFQELKLSENWIEYCFENSPFYSLSNKKW